jgi:hypothetical protein
MAVIAATNMQAAGVRTVTETTLGASDTFVYNASRNPVLYLNNETGGALTVTIDGSGGTTVPVAGIGNVSVADGYSTGSIAAGGVRAIVLSTISKYLQGTVTVTGGTGIVASLLEF